MRALPLRLARTSPVARAPLCHCGGSAVTGVARRNPIHHMPAGGPARLLHASATAVAWRVMSGKWGSQGVRRNSRLAASKGRVMSCCCHCGGSALIPLRWHSCATAVARSPEWIPRRHLQQHSHCRVRARSAHGRCHRRQVRSAPAPVGRPAAGLAQAERTCHANNHKRQLPYISVTT